MKEQIEIFSKEQIVKIKKSMVLANRTVFLNNHYLTEAVEIINLIITNSLYNNLKKISVNDVIFTDYSIGDRNISDRVESTDGNGNTTIEVSFSSKRKLSNILFDIYYPKAQDESYYHYTKISALRNIIKGELRLNPLISNANYDEFRTFYEEHNILGYFTNKDYDGTLMHDALMKEIYALSLASKKGLTKENEDSLWSSFADNGHGIRIEFEIKTNHPDFRKIFYRDNSFSKSDLVINRLNRVVNNLYERDLLIPGISKIGAFYLPGLYNIENEVRFVLKKHTDEYQFHFDDSNEYITLPFISKYAKFAIKKIKVGEQCTEEQIVEILHIIKENNYSSNILE